MASVGASQLLLLPALVTRSQAMPALFGPWGHPEPGSPGGPFPFPAVVRPRRQTPRAPLAAKRGVPSLGCASLNSLPCPGGAASWPGPPCHILVGHLSLHPSAFSPATLSYWGRCRAWWHRGQEASWTQRWWPTGLPRPCCPTEVAGPILESLCPSLL